jgi:Domain of unknown function (DUF4412)
MTRYHFLLALVIGGFVLGPVSLPAQEVRAPFTMDKQYSADVTITAKDNRTMKAKTYIDDEKMRLEMAIGDMKVATIIRKDKMKIYQVMISQKMIIEMDYDESKMKGREAAAFGPEGKFELIGPDTIDGVPVTKYKVTSDKTHQVFFFYLDLVKKVPVKMEAEDKSFILEWTNYKAGPQSPDLFEEPSGYQVMSMPMPTPGATGGVDGGGTPPPTQ